MIGRIPLTIIVISFLLAACEERDVAFCERFLKAGHADDDSYERLGLRIESRPLDPLEAQQLVFPNYRPNTYFPYRPGRTSFILDALKSYSSSVREIHVDYALGQGDNRRSVSGVCRFLLLDGNPQFVSALHLHDLLVRKALASEMHAPPDCCIRTNEKVR